MEDLFKFNPNNQLLSKDEYLKIFCKIALILRPDLETSVKVTLLNNKFHNKETHLH